jgi:hypothetical protein
MNQQIKEQLMLTAAELAVSPGIDMNNSFILLGGHERELYFRYKQDYEDYRQAIVPQFQINFTLVQE